MANYGPRKVIGTSACIWCGEPIVIHETSRKNNYPRACSRHKRKNNHVIYIYKGRNKQDCAKRRRLKELRKLAISALELCALLGQQQQEEQKRQTDGKENRQIASEEIVNSLYGTHRATESSAPIP